MLNDIRLIFRLRRQDRDYTIFRSNDLDGGWQAPQINPVPPSATCGNLPARLDTDILVADVVMRDAKYHGAFEAVDVRWLTDISVTTQQAYYVFHMIGQGPSYVAVGVTDRQVVPLDSLDYCFNILGTSTE